MPQGRIMAKKISQQLAIVFLIGILALGVILIADELGINERKSGPLLLVLAAIAANIYIAYEIRRGEPVKAIEQPKIQSGSSWSLAPMPAAAFGACSFVLAIGTTLAPSLQPVQANPIQGGGSIAIVAVAVAAKLTKRPDDISISGHHEVGRWN